MLSVEMLMDRLEERWLELRTKILVHNATFSSSGFIDTKKSCVVTSRRAVELAAAKSEEDRKWERMEAERIEGELKQMQRTSKQKADIDAFHDYQDRCHAAVCE